MKELEKDDLKAEWKRDVLKALIDLNKTVSGMARDLKVTPQWIYLIFKGDMNTQAETLWGRRISNYCGIKYWEDLENEED